MASLAVKGLSFYNLLLHSEIELELHRILGPSVVRVRNYDYNLPNGSCWL